MSSNTILDSIKQTLKENMPHGGEAFLYGSRARGDNRPDSDWDILLLLDNKEDDNRLGISYALFELGWKLNEDISPIMYSKEDWKKYSFTPFHHNVIDEGIKIYGT